MFCRCKAKPAFCFIAEVLGTARGLQEDLAALPGGHHDLCGSLIIYDDRPQAHTSLWQVAVLSDDQL